MPSTLRDFTVAPAAGGVTAPEGFRSAALHCGIKAAATALDLTVLAGATFKAARTLRGTALWHQGRGNVARPDGTRR